MIRLAFALCLAFLTCGAHAAPGSAPSSVLLSKIQTYLGSRAANDRESVDLRIMRLPPDSDLASRLSAYEELSADRDLAVDEGFQAILRDHIAALGSLMRDGAAPDLSELTPFEKIPSIGGAIVALERASRRSAMDDAEKSAQSLAAAAPAASLFPPTRSIVYSDDGMVAAPHPLAAQAGLEALRAGGTAADAAIAAWAVEPAGGDRAMSSYGGDLMILGFDAKSKKYYALNASGRSPKSLNIDAVLKKYPGAKLMPLDKPESWTVPGVVDGLDKLHKRFGRLKWSTLFRAAIDAAKRGTQMTRIVAEDGNWPGWSPKPLFDQPGFKETFMIDGRLPKEGERLKNPELAQTLEILAEKGRDAFYKGSIADAILDFSAKHGGYFTKEDFDRDDHAFWVEPHSTEYRGATVRELPPNGQGLAVLQILNILKLYDFKQLGWHPGHADFWHTFIEAKKLVYELMAKYYGDPHFVAAATIQWLLSDELSRDLQFRIDPKKAAVIADMRLPTPPGYKEGAPIELAPSVLPEASRIWAGDTTNLVVADKHGNMVSLIQSPYFPYGSGYIVRGFAWIKKFLRRPAKKRIGGIALQNRGALFSLDPTSPNALAGDKRPFHTIIPSILEYIRNGEKRRLAFSIMGADLQAYGQAMLVVYLMDFGMDIQQAIDAPRMVLSGSRTPNGKPPVKAGVFYAEPGIPQEVVAELQRRGHTATTTSDPIKLNYYAGGAHMIEERVTPSGDRYFAGASDPRKDGGAVPLLGERSRYPSLSTTLRSWLQSASGLWSRLLK